MTLWVLLALVGCRPTTPAPVASRPPPEGGYPDDPDARPWYLRAVVAEERGDLDEAERALEWVSRLDRRSPWPWVARGRLSERAGELSRALGAYERAIAIHPLPEAHLGRGRLRYAQGQPELARPDLEVAAGAGLDEGVELLGRLLIEAGDAEAARGWLLGWSPVGAEDRRTRAALLARVDPVEGALAWRALLDGADPRVDDARAMVEAARAGCRVALARDWLAERRAADWGPDWAELERQAAEPAADCPAEGP